MIFLMDSSGWIEFFTNGAHAGEYAKYLKDPARIVTPTIVLYETYKKIKRERTEEAILTEGRDLVGQELFNHQVKRCVG